MIYSRTIYKWGQLGLNRGYTPLLAGAPGAPDWRAQLVSVEALNRYLRGSALEYDPQVMTMTW